MANNFGRVNVSITASTGGLTRGLADASKQMRGFGGQVGGVGQGLKSAAATFLGMGRAATVSAIGVRALSMAINTLLAPLAIVLGAAAMFGKFARSAQELDEASKAARRLDMSTSTFQTLSQVAQEAGVEMGQLTTLLTIMSRNLGNLQAGSAAAQKAFANIGLTLADLQGLAPEKQFTLIAQRIMALPTAADRTAAAMAILGRQGAASLGLLSDVAGGAVEDVAKLQQQLGINLTDKQTKGIEMMNDALGRVSMVFQGFINQFLAELAPSITTVANLLVNFFAQNTTGWSLATTVAQGFAFVIRQIAAAFTFMYGVFQVVSAAIALFITGWIKLLEGVSYAIQSAISVMARAAEALPGFDVGLASSLRAAERSMGAVTGAASREAAVWGQAAADNFAKGIENIRNPYAAFDREFANVQKQMQDAGQAAGQGIGDGMQSGVQAAVKASTEALKAIVVGSSEGEAFMNSIRRGADPRNADDSARQTADNTERTAEAVEGIEENLAGIGGLAVAAISV